MKMNERKKFVYKLLQYCRYDLLSNLSCRNSQRKKPWFSVYDCIDLNYASSQLLASKDQTYS